MFTIAELQIMLQALVVQGKSVQRLGSKAGQPETVAAEYRKIAVEIDVLFKKVMAELVAKGAQQPIAKK